jgi:hypothetical protein
MSLPPPDNAPFDLKLWPDAPPWDGLRTAAVGRVPVASAGEAAALYERAFALLREGGYEAVIGPMDGDTWHAYRHVIESDGSEPFLMEPAPDPAGLAAMRAAGFEVIETYSSSRSPLAPPASPATMDGVTVAPWDGEDRDRLLADIHELSCEAFSRNPFYKPLDREGFDLLYRPLVPMLDRRLVLFARDAGGNLLGFVFGFPDLGHAGTCVLKTYASRRRGIGRVLVDAFNASASEAGFTQVIHALMHDANESLDRSGRQGAAVFRRYAMLGRRL